MISTDIQVACGSQPIEDEINGTEPLSEFERALSELGVDVKHALTASYSGRLYQVMDKTNARKVIVEKRINGTMAITHNGNRLKCKEITERPEKEQKKQVPLVIKKKKTYIPPPNHPWRRYKLVIENNSYQQQELQT